MYIHSAALLCWLTMVHCLSPGSSLALALYSFFRVFRFLSLSSLFLSLLNFAVSPVPPCLLYPIVNIGILCFTTFVASLPLFLRVRLHFSLTGYIPLPPRFSLRSSATSRVILLQSLYLFTSSVYVSKRTATGRFTPILMYFWM